MAKTIWNPWKRILELQKDVNRLEEELHNMTKSNIEKSRDLFNKDLEIAKLQGYLIDAKNDRIKQYSEFEKEYAALLERHITMMERVARLDDRREETKDMRGMR